MSHPAGTEAFLYLASPEAWTRGRHRDQALALLSPDERERYERFRVPAPARAFLTGRALVRRVLELHAETPAVEWRLEPDEHGRPRILGPGSPPSLEFNLTHNDRIVACLVTGGAACGVDVESLDREVEPHRIAEHSFCEEESEELARLEGDSLTERFFTYWTLKEAYLKARGRGIAMRLDSVLFRLSPATGCDRIEARFADRTGDEPERWSFTLYRPEERQCLAVAVAGGDLALRTFRSRPEDPRAEEVVLEPIAASDRRSRSV